MHRRPMPPSDGVRCQHCGKKLAERLAGELHVVCPRCKTQQVIRGGFPPEQETRHAVKRGHSQ